jgi:hypothetical protein
MDPFLSLRPLPSNVEHAVGKILNDECCLRYTGSLDTRSEDVLIVRHIVVGCDAIYRIEVAKQGRKNVSLGGLLGKMFELTCERYGASYLLSCGIVELVLSRPLKALLHSGIFP